MKLSLALVAALVSTALAAPRTADEVNAANVKAYSDALAKQKLTPIALTQDKREMTHSMSAPVSAPGHIELNVSAGWNQQSVELVTNDKHEVYVVARAPHLVATIIDHIGCPSHRFAGGRAWFEHVSYALPAGYTYKGTIKVAYDITLWKQVEPATCPDVPWAMD